MINSKGAMLIQEGKEIDSTFDNAQELSIKHRTNVIVMRKNNPIMFFDQGKFSEVPAEAFKSSLASVVFENVKHQRGKDVVAALKVLRLFESIGGKL